MNRLAPIETPNHPEVIEYLDELSIQWKLRRMGEPHTLTLELIGHWRTVRKQLSICDNINLDFYHLGQRPNIKAHHEPHNAQIMIVDRIILELEAEYGWPAPLQPMINELDIQQLRQAIRDIENCRSGPKVWY